MTRNLVGATMAAMIATAISGVAATAGEFEHPYALGDQIRGGMAVDGSVTALHGRLTEAGWYVGAAGGMRASGYGEESIPATGSALLPTVRAATGWSIPFVVVEAGYTVEHGNFAFGPAVGIRYSLDRIGGPAEPGPGRLSLAAGDRPGRSVVGSLGVRGAARFDSRIGAIFSRLSLSFEHEFSADERSVVAGLPPGGALGSYANAAVVDIMKIDASVALRLSPSVVGGIDYSASMDMQSSDDHQVMATLTFDF